MKVLVVSNLYPPAFLGGYELACAQMAEALERAGHDVRVVTSVSAGPRAGDTAGVKRILELAPLYNAARMQSVSHDAQRYFYLRSHAVNPANAAALADEIEVFDPDVAYLWNLLGIGGLGVLALLGHQGIPWVWHIEDVIPRQLCGFASSGAELARSLGGVFPGRYIMCSSHVLGEIRAGDVDLGDRIHVIPNWVTGTPPSARTDFYDGGHLRLVTASGVLSEPKGTHILIEAAGRLRELGHENFSIDVYGVEHDLRFRALAYKYAAADLVRFMGPRTHSDLIALYSGYDLLAFPTWAREPFGLAPLEAAAAGCVPLFSNDCGIAEWMVDGVDCLKAARSSEGFAQSIARVLSGEIGLAELGRRGQRVVWRDFHVESASAKVEEILAAAALDRAPRRGTGRDFFAFAQFAEGLLHALLQESPAP